MELLCKPAASVKRYFLILSFSHPSKKLSGCSGANLIFVLIRVQSEDLKIFYMRVTCCLSVAPGVFSWTREVTPISKQYVWYVHFLDGSAGSDNVGPQQWFKAWYRRKFRNLSECWAGSQSNVSEYDAKCESVKGSQTLWQVTVLITSAAKYSGRYAEASTHYHYVNSSRM